LEKKLPKNAPCARVHEEKEIEFFFGFFGEMKQEKGSLGLGKRLKHSFTPISLILFLISSISVIFAKRVLTLERVLASS
jgi:hypothetical protein